MQRYLVPCLDFCNVLAAARQSFKEQEALVYQQLAQLIRDGVWLKSYLAAVMRLEQEAFQVLRAHAPFIAHVVPCQAPIVSLHKWPGTISHLLPLGVMWKWWNLV